jgi:hypothetical protein
VPCMGSSALTAAAVSKNAPIPMLPSSSWRRDSRFMRVAIATAPCCCDPAAFNYHVVEQPIRLEYMAFVNSP